MRLYYMTAEKWAQTILAEARLKLSLFDELNDPFELLGASIGGHETRRVVTFLRAHWSKTYGLLCMSDNWHSPLMWAHYADKHRGICLGFDIEDGLWWQMRYVADRISLPLDVTKPVLGLDAAKLRSLMEVKAMDWAYEREYRMSSKLTDVEENGFYYVDFSNALVLREVILGARCTTPIHSVARSVGQPARTVTVHRARAAFETFEIVRQKNQKAIVILGSIERGGR